MCGFATFFSSESSLNPQYRFPQPWMGLIQHRGPDAQQSFVESSAAMHFARLKIIDLTDQGMQPMVSSSGRYVLAFNGEIVNFRALAQRYGLTLRGHSDSEVLLELYQKRQAQMLPELRGMFAFVVYDRVTHSVEAFRDPFGIKPLYYTLHTSHLLLASEIRTLRTALGDPPLRDSGIIRFLKRGSIDDGEQTLFEGIQQVPPGHHLTWKNGTLQVRPYQQQTLRPQPIQEEAAQAQTYYETLRRVVGEYLYADVPVGVSLSGGFDSSLLAHLVRANLPSAHSIHMFCRGYQDYEGNELQAAEAVSRKFNLQFHPVILSPKEIPDMLRSCSRKQEHPITSISILAYHKMYEEARRCNIKVLLEGHGGDELWAGYAAYAQEGDSGRSQDGSSFVLNDEIVLPDLEEAQATPTPWLKAESSSLTQRQLTDLFGSKLQRSLRFVDRASMASHREVRVPYLDTDVALPALCLPDSWKIRNGQQLRHFVREMARPHLGDAVALRPKVPIQDPQRKWLQKELKTYVMDLLHSDGLWVGRFVNLNRMRSLYGEFLENPDRFGNLTFLLFPIFLEEWHRADQEEAIAPAQQKHPFVRMDANEPSKHSL